MNSQSVAASSIPVRDFRAIFLWALRLKPEGEELADGARHDHTCSSSQWLGKYADWICAAHGSQWQDSGPYRSHNFRIHTPTAEQSYAEFVYFHPFIQKFLFGNAASAPTKAPAVRMLHRSDIRYAQVQLGPGDPILKFPVERVQLILFPSDVAIVAVQLDHPGDLNLAQTQDFLDWGRRVYSPYFYGPGQPGKVPHAMCWLDRQGNPVGRPSNFKTINPNHPTVPVAAHWESLVQPLTPHGGVLNFEQVEDDRLPTMAFLAVDHPELVSRADMVRLAFLDEHGSPDEYPYSRYFLADFEKEHCYDRFWSPGAPENWNTRVFCTDYSFVMLGQAATFFTGVVSAHFEQHYFVLALVAHMQKASLLAYWDRLAELVHDFEREPPSASSRHSFFDRQKWLLGDLADFTSRFWFTEVSNQLQAQELFDIWTKQLKTRSLFDQVTAQARLVREVQSIQWQGQAEKVAVGAVIATLVTTFFAVVVALPGFRALFGLKADTDLESCGFWCLVAVVLALIASTTGLLYRLWRRQMHGPVPHVKPSK